jgi:hypothetical protein
MTPRFGEGPAHDYDAVMLSAAKHLANPRGAMR